jgi:hypothetical protein
MEGCVYASCMPPNCLLVPENYLSLARRQHPTLSTSGALLASRQETTHENGRVKHGLANHQWRGSNPVKTNGQHGRMTDDLLEAYQCRQRQKSTVDQYVVKFRTVHSFIHNLDPRVPT